MLTHEQARDMAEAHGEGLHADLPRKGCPACEDLELSSHPRAGDVEAEKNRSWPIA